VSLWIYKNHSQTINTAAFMKNLSYTVLQPYMFDLAVAAMVATLQSSIIPSNYHYYQYDPIKIS
jgi:hypothetical protein